MRLFSLEIAQAVNALKHSVQTGAIPSGYSIDSRTLQPGECFIAIRGRNFDGHGFIPEAVSRGASLVIAQTESVSPDVTGIGLIFVDDTLKALQRLANYIRRKWGKTVVGITGSTGKTTTKEIASFLLESRFKVFKSQGNFNNDYGLPLSIVKLSERDDIAVLELGMSAPGEISRLSQIAEPNIGIVTNVKPVHLEFFASIDEIALAKRELIENLPPDGTAILNNDDTLTRKFGRYFRGKVLTFGLDTRATYHVSEIRSNGLSGSEFRLDHKGKGHLFSLPLIGIHNIRNCLTGIAVAHQLGIGFEVIRQRMQDLKPSSGRGQVLEFAEGFRVIDDSYNSNPAALETMIHFLKELPKDQRKILVSGEMLELGHKGPDFHRACGKLAAKSKLDFIVGVRGHALELVNGARDLGYDFSRSPFFEDALAAGEWLTRQVRPGDLILVKGSRGVKTEQIIEVLKRDHMLKVG